MRLDASYHHNSFCCLPKAREFLKKKWFIPFAIEETSTTMMVMNRVLN
jgi:hypothetical protein